MLQSLGYYLKLAEAIYNFKTQRKILAESEEDKLSQLPYEVKVVTHNGVSCATLF